MRALANLSAGAVGKGVRLFFPSRKFSVNGGRAGQRSQRPKLREPRRLRSSICAFAPTCRPPLAFSALALLP
jgi:hypothetical protein